MKFISNFDFVVTVPEIISNILLSEELLSLQAQGTGLETGPLEFLRKLIQKYKDKVQRFSEIILKLNFSTPKNSTTKQR